MDSGQTSMIISDDVSVNLTTWPLVKQATNQLLQQLFQYLPGCIFSQVQGNYEIAWIDRQGQHVLAAYLEPYPQFGSDQNAREWLSNFNSSKWVAPAILSVNAGQTSYLMINGVIIKKPATVGSIRQFFHQATNLGLVA